MEKALNQYTTEELQAMLDQKQKEAKEQARKERETLETDVIKVIDKLFSKAEAVSSSMIDLVEDCGKESTNLRDRLNNYGMIRSNSKGGYKIEDKGRKIVFAYRSEGEYDFRAAKAEGLLKDFLTDFVKKRDAKVYKMVSALLERNKEGDLEYSRMQALYAMENEYDDPRWKEAIRLFKESFKITGSCITPRFYKRNESTGKWHLIPLNIYGF